MSRQRRFNNIIKVTREQFLFMHNFNSSGGDVWYLNYVVLEHCCCYTHLHKHSNSLVPLPWCCHPRSGGVVSRPAPTPGAVMEWWSGQGWQGCDSHWAQSSLYIGSRSKVRITITQRRVSWSSGWLQRFVFGSQTLCQFYFQPNEHSKVFGIMIWKVKTSSHNTLPLYIYYGCIVHNIQYSAWYYWLYIP